MVTSPEQHRRNPLRGERLRPALAVIAILGLLYILWASTQAFGEAGRYFARATYLAECVPHPNPVNDRQCADLAKQRPHTPDDIDITDQSVLLAEGAAMHSTATGVLTLAGLWLATFGVLLTALRPRPSAPS